MRILVLATDAFGGRGGIAQYNRDFLKSACSWARCEEVITIPRAVAYEDNATLPDRLTYVTNGLNSKLKYAASVFNRVRQDSRIDMVVAAHINLLPFAYVASRRCGAPLGLIIYGVDAWQPTRRSITNRLASKIDFVISISNLTLDRFRAWSGADPVLSFLLPNAVDMVHLHPGPRNKTLTDRYGLEGKKVLMTLGRLQSDDRYKGVDEILELLPGLARELPDIRYLVIGDGTDRPRLEEKARSLGIPDLVVFSGYVDEESKLDHYRLADAYVMPCSGEGFGFVFLEAMAAGIPVVASKIDGSREAVRDGKLGILVDPRDPEETRNGILQALLQPRGTVPEGLDYFSYPRFEARVHTIMDALLPAKVTAA